jgi:hypothetical protein
MSTTLPLRPGVVTPNYIWEEYKVPVVFLWGINGDADFVGR